MAIAPAPRSLACLAALAFCLGAASLPQEATTSQARPQQPQARPQQTPARPVAASGETFTIDGTHSMALFRVQHLGAGAFWGRFNTLSGTIVHDPSRDDGLSIDVTIHVPSIDSGNESLDTHLKSGDFFAAEEHPEATFKSIGAKKIGEHTYEVKGELTMRGVTKRITVEVLWVGTANSPRGRRCGFETDFTVDRTDYGISYGAEGGMLGIDTRIIVAMEAVAGGGRGQGAGRGQGPGGGGAGRMIERFDTNGDGKLQKDELPEGIQAMFEDLDIDGDGALDADELPLRGRGGVRGPGGAPGSSGSGGAPGSGGSGGGGTGGGN